MLRELRIKDLAIIDSLEISFDKGLTVFTGETGAGKSIIIDAIDLVLGDRAAADLIRSGAEEARVEALFDISGMEEVCGILDHSGLAADGSQVIITRILRKGGANRIYINGSLSTLVTLTDISKRFVDVYGQSEHQSLTRPDEHLEILDSFTGLPELRTRMRDACRRWAAAKKSLDEFESSAKKDSEERELVEFQLREISAASLKDGEDRELAKERERLRNSERLFNAAEGAERVLYSGDGSVLSRLAAIKKEAADAARFDPSLEAAVKRLDAVILELEDVAGFFRGYAGAVESNPEKLSCIEERLYAIERLKKKYGPSITDVLRRSEALGRRLASIGNYAEKIKTLAEEEEKARSEAARTSGELTAERKKAAVGLKKQLEKELSELGITGCVFEVSFGKEPRFGEKGEDRISFLISANPGEALKPLSKVASGGELSRIMLAIKNISAAGKVPTMIFDEVDSGVGASMALAVGKKLKAIGRDRQVFCITHLPHIAALADSHFFVSKSATKQGRTVTRVKKLSSQERVEAIAAMLSGPKITEASVTQAKEMLKGAGDKSPERHW